MYGIVDFVLHFFKEILRDFGLWVVVDTGGINIQNLAIKNFFTGANITNAFEKFFEIIPATELLEAFIVHHEAFADILIQTFSGPLTKLSPTNRLHSIANGNNYIEIIIISGLRRKFGNSEFSNRITFCGFLAI